MVRGVHIFISLFVNFSSGQGSSSLGGAQVCPLVGTECLGPSGRAGSDEASGGSGHQHSLQSADGERLEHDGYQNWSAGEEQDHSTGQQHFCYQ